MLPLFYFPWFRNRWCVQRLDFYSHVHFLISQSTVNLEEDEVFTEIIVTIVYQDSSQAVTLPVQIKCVINVAGSDFFVRLAFHYIMRHHAIAYIMMDRVQNIRSGGDDFIVHPDFLFLPVLC